MQDLGCLSGERSACFAGQRHFDGDFINVQCAADPHVDHANRHAWPHLLHHDPHAAAAESPCACWPTPQHVLSGVPSGLIQSFGDDSDSRQLDPRS